MNPEELRLGNLVEYEYASYSLVGYNKKYVFLEDCFSIIKLCDPFIAELSAVNPIPITEEWLLKLGFKLVDPKASCKSYSISINDKGDMLSLTDISGKKQGYYHFNLYGRGKQSFVGRHLEFVHEVQNLYNSITGKELTISIESITKSRMLCQ